MQREKLLRYLPESIVDWLRLVRAVWLPKEYEPELTAVIRQIVRLDGYALMSGQI
jgi:hypothetical protein